MVRRALKWLALLALAGALVVAVLLVALRPPSIAVPHQNAFALHDVVVVEPGRMRRVGQDVMVDQGRIQSISEHDRAAENDAPGGPFAGHYALPGLIDMHGHHPVPWMVGESQLWDLLYLAHGVTTVRDPHVPDGTAVGTTLLDRRRQIRDGEVAGPRLFTCGQALDGTRGTGVRFVSSPEQAHAAVAELADAGVDCIKVRSNLAADVMGAIRLAATQRELPLIGHVPLSVSLEEARLDDVQHLYGIGERRPVRRWGDIWGRWAELEDDDLDAVVQTSLAHGMAHTPTLVFMVRYAHQRETLERGDPVLQLLPPHWRDVTWTADGPFVLFHRDTPEELAALRRALPRMRELLHRMHEAGVPLHLGTDPLLPHVIPGASLHEEMAQFLLAGVTPEEAWAYATRGAGAWLGEPGLGTIQVGAPADLLLFREDPSRDLSSLASLVAVVADGRLYTKEALEEKLSRSRAHFDGALYNAVIGTISRTLGALLDALMRLRPDPAR